MNDEVLRQIAADQARTAEALEGHAKLDEERFRQQGAKLDRIEANTQSLLDSRTHAQGVRWAAAKVAALVGGAVTAAGVAVAAWLRG